MSEASSLAGRKRDRAPRTRGNAGTSRLRIAASLGRLDAVRKACHATRGRPYGLALNDLADELQKIFSARLVVIRDCGPMMGRADFGISPE